uniref:uncharacterized protein At1g01500 n=1 Tax=Erigeron canadensis TaxID=72917 RepID=UPI001CB9CE37|nr:uncharacterized protein At1g01500 [Erigeron canadensis]
MCRGFQQNERHRPLKIKAFYILISIHSKTKKHAFLPDSLTLHYLPRINGSPLEINGSMIRPDSPAFVTLYRVVSNNEGLHGEIKAVTYGSREKVRVSEGVRFEVYLKEEKVVKGGYRKDEGGEWKMECRCGLEGDNDNYMVDFVKDLEVSVAAEDGGEVVVMRREKVVMKRRKRRRCFEGLLEEIPEQISEGEEVEEEEEGCCCCCAGVDDDGLTAEDGGDVVELEVEGVMRWAVDVGIWAMCLGVGVGYLVSKASSKSLRRRLIL